MENSNLALFIFSTPTLGFFGVKNYFIDDLFGKNETKNIPGVGLLKIFYFK